jgi:hypothetical protein
MAMHPDLSFIITIDTEEDNAWARRDQATTENAKYLPRFPALCERFGFKPTYLTTNQMAEDPAFAEMASDALRRGTAEVGLHLHAWECPPHRPITDRDAQMHPYLKDFPVQVIREKIGYLTELLESRFGTKMRSHRSGRWALDSIVVRVLLEFGYWVDCSVTPGVSWADASGAPGHWGSDYTGFPEDAYFMDLDDISRPGDSPMLEVPMTIHSSWFHRNLPWTYNGMPGRALRRVMPDVAWLRPNGRNLDEMLKIVDRSLRRQRSYTEFMLHSSEFMPGCSPTFRDEASIERLFEHLEALFAAIARHYRGRTLSEFHDLVAAQRQNAPGARQPATAPAARDTILL